MKIGDLVSAADKTSYQTLWEGTGILIRPDEGRTYVEWTSSGRFSVMMASVALLTVEILR